jgi:Ca2+-dependent lipid-binding protein
MESYNPGMGAVAMADDTPKQKIQLFIKCRKLRDLDYIGKSDPYCEVWLKNDERTDWIMVAKTDTVINSLNPDFNTPIELDYYFEKTQKIRFEVYDQDQGSSEIQGSHETKVSNLVGAKNQTYAADLTRNGKTGKNGKIIITTDSLKSSNKSVFMSISCNGLKPKKEFLGMGNTNHPFLIIKR